MPDFRLDGKKALVTGAARGLGKAIADGLAESGATVYGTSRDAESARLISERYGTPAFPWTSRNRRKSSNSPTT